MRSEKEIRDEFDIFEEELKRINERLSKTGSRYRVIVLDTKRDIKESTGEDEK